MSAVTEPETKPRFLNTVDIINNLRSLANFLAQDPDFPLPFSVYGMKSPQQFRCYIFSKDKLREIARALGTFKKSYNDTYFELIVDVTDTLQLVYYCDRSLVCKSHVVYDCEDAESILRDLVGNEVPVAPAPVATADDIPF